jgi:hypothetical protein
MASKGLGSMITIKRLRGLGRLNQPASALGSIAPPVLGALLAGLTALGLRYFVKPEEGETQAGMFRWAPLIGGAVSALGATALYALAGAPAAFMAASSGVMTSGLLFAHDKLMEARAAEAIAGAGGQTSGLGVVVPQRLMSGIVMENAAMRNPYKRYGISGPYGETVQIQGINPSAFGTPGN